MERKHRIVHLTGDINVPNCSQCPEIEKKKHQNVKMEHFQMEMEKGMANISKSRELNRFLSITQLTY